MLIIAPLLIFNLFAGIIVGQTVYPVDVCQHDTYHHLEFEHYSSIDGMPGNSCLSIYQDRQGFIWLGTDNGPAKFDGYTFQLFPHKPDDSTTVCANPIWSIFEDEEGNIWLGTENHGICVYNRSTGDFYHFKHDPDDPTSLGEGLVSDIIQDKEGTIWVATRGGGLNKFDRESKSFARFIHDPKDPSSLSNNLVVSLLEDQQGNFWVGTWGDGLNLFDRNSGHFRVFRHDTRDASSISGDEIPAIYEDIHGKLWVGTTHGGLDEFDREKEVFYHHRHAESNQNSVANNTVFRITGDHQGNLLIGTWGEGLDIYSPDENSFYHYAPSGDPHSLSNKFVFSVLVDRSGSLWVGTDNALNHASLSTKQFMHLIPRQGLDRIIFHQTVLSLFQDQEGIVWAGTAGGLFSLDLNLNQVAEYNDINQNNNFPNDYRITAISQDKQGYLWFGTSQGTLIRYDKVSGKKSRYDYSKKLKNRASGKLIYSIYCDRKNNIWLGTNGDGIVRYNPGDGTVIMSLPPDDADYNLDQRIIRDIDPLPDGKLLVGTRSGLLVFDPETMLFNKPALNDSSVSLAKLPLNISEIYTSDNNTYLLGTTNSGLIGYDRNTGLLNQYGKEGLSDIYINCIVTDYYNGIWLGTKKGLMLLPDNKDSRRYYDEHDGLIDGQIYKSIRLHDGTIMLGGENGLNFFKPENLLDNTISPQIAFTRVLQDDIQIETLYQDQAMANYIISYDDIKINNHRSKITFEFSALHYAEPGQNQYSHILEGFDDDWSPASPVRTVSYNNLSPGSYIFRVRASNGDGVWNNEGTSIKVIIKAPFYRTWIAFIIYFIILLVGLISLRRYELNRQKVKHELELEKHVSENLRELDTMKSSFFANISHEFRTPLSLIMGMNQNILDSSRENYTLDQAGRIKRNSYKLLALINQLLDLSKLEAGKMKLRASETNLVAFVKFLFLSFESLAVRKDISIQFLPESDQIDVYFDRDMMDKIISNLLSNAIKFTPEGGEIQIIIAKTSARNKVEVKIRDNGIGIDKGSLEKLFDRFYQVDKSDLRENEGTGIGLALTKELIELHHGSIKAESEPGEWTEFTMTLPLGGGHLNQADIVVPEKGQLMTHHAVHEMESMDEKVTDKHVNEWDVEDEQDKPILLIVEDNYDFRLYIKELFCLHYHVKEANDGELGLKKARNIVPDLIISDVMMPKLDGNELVKILKKDEVTSHIPIILLTARSDQESKLEGLSTGADDYLAKPFDPMELKLKVKNLIHTRSILQEKFSHGDSPAKPPAAVKSNPVDEKFMARVLEVIESHYADEDFNIQDLSKGVGMSRTQLHRKLKALTGKSASQYIRSLRLMKAKTLIEEQAGTISEIAYSVGFSSPAYFTRCFKEEFGYPPSET